MLLFHPAVEIEIEMNKWLDGYESINHLSCHVLSQNILMQFE